MWHAIWHICDTCLKQLVIKSLPTRNKSYAFLRNKRYSEHCNLIYPAMKFVKFVENKAFFLYLQCTSFELHMASALGPSLEFRTVLLSIYFEIDMTS